MILCGLSFLFVKREGSSSLSTDRERLRVLGQMWIDFLPRRDGRGLGRLSEYAGDHGGLLRGSTGSVIMGSSARHPGFKGKAGSHADLDFCQCYGSKAMGKGDKGIGRKVAEGTKSATPI